jgi:hypothetical protein
VTERGCLVQNEMVTTTEFDEFKRALIDASPEGKVPLIVAWYMDGKQDREPWSSVDAELNLRVPPESHVFDSIVSTREVLNEDESYGGYLRGVLTVALRQDLPQCDICNEETARYDAEITTSGNGMWGFMCEYCYERSSRLKLGSGFGQYLMKTSEIPHDVRAALSGLVDEI